MLPCPSHRPAVRAAIVGAFTLAEMMVTMAIFSLVVIAMVSLQIFGFKMNALTSNKLRSTTDSLKVLDHIRNQIRGATNIVLIGYSNPGNNKFTAIPATSQQIGSAVQISNSPNNCVTFYLNTNTGILYELGSATNSQPMALNRTKLINLLPFQTEDCNGNVLSSQNEHYTIKMTLQFSNLVYSVPTPTYDNYRLESRATPREQD
jgi:prepilin-type N-terminal cleavage/methylation domain-containing protein